MINVRTLMRKYKKLKLRTKLIISYIILISIPSLTTGLIYYNKSAEIVFDNSKQSFYEIVKKNNQIMDMKLSEAEDSSLMIAIDKNLFQIMNGGNPDGDDKLIKQDIEVSQIIRNYFSMNKDEYSVYIATNYFIFGSNANMFIPLKNFNTTKIYSSALEAKGKLQWVPTYDFTDMYNLKGLKETKIDYRYLFSAVRLLNCSLVSSENNTGSSVKISGLKSGIQSPVLLINFKQELYRDLFLNCVPVKGATYCIIDRNGHIISNTDKNIIGKIEDPIWLEQAIKNGSGIANFTLKRRKYLLCYDTSKVTGWISAIVIPNSNILNSLPIILNYTLYFCIVLTILSIILAFILSGLITNPIKKLIAGLKSSGEGDFDNKIKVTTGDEIGILVKNFNEMNKKISVLIEENYEVKIRENEAQIMALNLQLNPHFMSNTLNVINWMAIEGGQPEISRMILSLSSMLRYTMQNTKEMVIFKYDFEWLKNYIYIMSNRYTNLFIFEYNVDMLLNEISVPKMFLQPFVENSIIHAFTNIDNGGKININGWIYKDKIYFSIEDNGRGMSKERVVEIMNCTGESIGIMNIDKRIKLIFGSLYGVSIESIEGAGTKIIITMPYVS